MMKSLWMGMLLLALGGIGAAGCATSQPGGHAGDQGVNAGASAASADSVEVGATGTAAASHVDEAKTSDVPIPANAQYTIALRTFSGENNDLVARRMKAQMLESGLSGAYVVVGEKESTLYYGFYSSATDPRARADMANLVKWKSPTGERPLGTPLLVELNPKDPPAPPEWNLANSKMYWSLQIGAYKDSPDRKKAAVEAVREARARGIEAFFYHGETTSSVCIGAWPRKAIREQSSDRGETDAADMDRPIVVSTIPLAGLIDGPVIDRATGETAKVYAPRIQIDDPTLMAAMKQYPYHAVNGVLHAQVVVDPKTGERHSVNDRSFLVVIPGAEKRYQEHLAQDNGTAPATPNATHKGNPIPPSMLLGRPAPAGKLKSLGD